MKKYKFTQEHKNKIRLAHIGKKWNERMREKMSGKSHPTWKGDKASYRAKHIWMETNYGKPTTCEHCQTNNLIGRQIHWANISGLYKRDRTDWLRLCRKCHGLFDKIKRQKCLKS